MDEDLKRTRQVSIKLNRHEWDLLEALIGHRGLYERSDVLRYGLQLVREERDTPLFQALNTGPEPKRQRKTKGGS